MTAKFGAARQRAFLAALARTGNLTLAAERAKVSRSWVHLHRSGDPGFRRAVEEAIAEARKALALHQERKPPSRWSFHDGEELVVKGTALYLPHMHKHQVRGVGKRPGLRAREPGIEDVCAEVLRKVEVLKRPRRLSAA